MEQWRANHGPRFCLFLEKLVTPATIGQNAYLLDSVKIVLKYATVKSQSMNGDFSLMTKNSLLN